MALLGREFIAVPDDRKGQIIYKWPDVSIRRYSQAIVNADEQAFFVNTGQIAQPMGPGRHSIDADELPGLGIFIDAATAGRAYRAELYFVGTREFTGFTFGGRIDDVQDPQTGLIVTLRVFGDYAVRVVDAAKTVTNLVGTVDVSDNTKISAWVSDQLLKVMRTAITTQIVRNGWPILGLSAYTTDIEPVVIEKGNEQLAPYGVAITRMGNFDINLSPEDTDQIKKLAKDTSYSRLAGSFNQYAAGEAQLGAGEGMAQGGGAVSGAFLGAGLGAIGGAMQAPVTAPPVSGFAGGGAGFSAAGGAPANKVACANCDAGNEPSSKFCANCGQPMVVSVMHCTECGNEVAADTKFCANCGHAVAPPTQSEG